MSKNKYEGRPFHVVMYVSRNKDNKHITNFKQRTKSFLTQKYPHELLKEFEEFSKKGLPGEISRFYISVNDRNMDKVKLDLQHYLIDHPDTNLANIEKLIASLSMKKGTPNSKKFLFDFDNNDSKQVSLFIEDIKEIEKDIIVYSRRTINGFVVVTDRGFDTRKLLEKWNDVELKRDGMKFVHSIINNKEEE